MPAGVLIGLLLLFAVTAIALLLGRKAAANVERFREEHYEQFTAWSDRR